MKDTLQYILSHLVDHPDDLRIEEQITDNKTVLVIYANTEDNGKIIGKQGRIIRAIRELIKLIAAKHALYVDVVLADQ